MGADISDIYFSLSGGRISRRWPFDGTFLNLIALQFMPQIQIRSRQKGSKRRCGLQFFHAAVCVPTEDLEERWGANFVICAGIIRNLEQGNQNGSIGSTRYDALWCAPLWLNSAHGPATATHLICDVQNIRGKSCASRKLDSWSYCSCQDRE